MACDRAAFAQQAAWRGWTTARSSTRSSLTCGRVSPWRDLPERYSLYTTAYNRHKGWAKAGFWLKIFEALTERSPQSLALIDSSIIRAHQHAAGREKGVRITPLAVLEED